MYIGEESKSTSTSASEDKKQSSPPAIQPVKSAPARKKGNLSEEEKAEAKRLQAEAAKAYRKQLPENTPSFVQDTERGYHYFQDQVLTFKESMHIHFKPSNNRSCLNFSLFFFDFIFAIVFQIGHMYFFINA